MSKEPRITRRAPYTVRLSEAAKLRIPGLASKLGMTQAELIEAALNEIDNAASEAKRKTLAEVRAYISEADTRLAKLEGRKS